MQSLLRVCYLWRRPDAQIWTTAEAFKLIEALSKNVSEIVFGGGDPLMRADIIDLTKYAKSFGLKVELHTNAVLLDSIDYTALFKTLTRLGVSLDGEDEATHDKMRAASGNFRQSLRALDLAGQLKLPTTVRTVYTRRNLNNIEGIGYLLARYPYVDKWSIRQFAPLGRGNKTRSAFEVKDDEFHEKTQAIVSKVKLTKPHFQLNIVSKRDLENCFCLIAEDGVFYAHPHEGDYQALGKYPDESVEAIIARLEYRKTDKRDWGRDERWRTGLRSSNGIH